MNEPATRRTSCWWGLWGGEIGDHQHHHRRALGGEEIPCPHRRSPLPNRRAEEEDHDTPYVVSPCYTPGVPAVWGLIIS